MFHFQGTRILQLVVEIGGERSFQRHSSPGQKFEEEAFNQIHPEQAINLHVNI